MDPYHQVLVELYKETNGRETKQIDFIALHKKIGFYANYSDISTRLNREGWISDAATKDFVSITHWGVAEAKKSIKAETNPEAANAELKKEAQKAYGSAKEFSILMETFVENVSAQTLSTAKIKLDEISEMLNQMKSKL
jgi:hypothetical protein